MTSCRAGKTTAFASNSLQHPISVAFSVAVARSWMEKLPTLWRDRGPVSSPEFAFNGLTAPHTPRQSTGMRRSMGLDRRILQITFDVHGKTDAFEEKTRRRSSGRVNEISQVRRPGKRLLPNERSSRVDASADEVTIYGDIRLYGEVQGRAEQLVFIAHVQPLMSRPR